MNNPINMVPYDAIDYMNDKAILLNGVDNRLYVTDIRSGIVNDFCQFASSLNTKEPIGSLIMAGDYIIGTPNVERFITIYNILQNTIEYIPVPEKGLYFGKGIFLFSSGMVYNRKLFLFGNAYPGIISFDLDTREMECITDWIDLNRNYSEEDGCFHLGFYRSENVVYLPFMNTNAVLEFHLDDNKSIIHNVGDEKQRYLSIEYIRGLFYLVPRDGRYGSLVCWNPVTGETKQYSDYPKGFDYNKYSFYRTAVVDDKVLIMFAHRGNMNVAFDVQTESMHMFRDLYDTRDIPFKKYSAMIKREELMLFFTSKGIIEWNQKNNSVKSVEYIYGDDVVQRMNYETEVTSKVKKFEMEIKNKNIIYENNSVDCASLIHYLKK